MSKMLPLCRADIFMKEDVGTVEQREDLKKQILHAKENNIGGVGGSNDILCISGQSLHRTGSNGAGLHFTSSAIFPTDSDGNSVNGSIDFGSSTKRWNNIFTSDLDLSNEAKGVNDIDGTWGHYTIVEGESDLFLKNNRSGKTYKFNLTEIS